MLYKIQEEINLDVKPCMCGEYPDFIIPDHNYTDCWLMCYGCGNQTSNTGGYSYGDEIPLVLAKKKAIKAWNNREFRKPKALLDNENKQS